MLDAWNRSQSGAITATALRILEGRCVSNDLVYIPFSCAKMLATPRRYAGSKVLLAADAKMGVLRGGWGVVSVGVLVKRGLRRTTLTRGLGMRVQGASCTTSFVPLLQAACSSESKVYTRLFEQVTASWNAQIGDDSLRLPQAAAQVHKDFLCGSENARREHFPSARPCDDYAHFLRNVRKHLPRKGGVGQRSADIVFPSLRPNPCLVLARAGGLLGEASWRWSTQTCGVPLTHVHTPRHQSSSLSTIWRPCTV